MHSLSPEGAQGNHQPLEAAKVRFKEEAREELKRQKVDQKAIAWEVGLCESVVTRWLGESYQEAMPIHILPFWTREAGPGLLGWIARRCGFDLVRRPAQEEHLDLIETASLLAGQFGQTLQHLVQSFKDKKWTAKEKREDLPVIRAAYNTLGRLIDEAEREG